MAIRNVHDFMKIFDIKNKEDEVLAHLHQQWQKYYSMQAERGVERQEEEIRDTNKKTSNERGRERRDEARIA